MDARPHQLDSRIAKLDALLAAATPTFSGGARAAVDRWRTDAAAMRFHLRRKPSDGPPVLAVIGGTGTGKSTLVNRLLGANVSAASFRRTFTAGPVALVGADGALPNGWLAIEPKPANADQLPARGQPGTLIVATVATDLTSRLTLVDTPDLDGDQPAHHAQADRAFRWADAVLFLVTPEKYQMTELLPYYRLARRYGLPTLHVMNKCEEQAVLDDYRSLLDREVGPGDAARVYAIARDDAGYEPPAEQNFAALRSSIAALPDAPRISTTSGLSLRGRDLVGRLTDQVIAPLRDDRREADRLIAALRAMESPTIGVDVNPLTQQLERRLQQRSILYLMGPQRILDRVRQAPGLLARLPRVAWDYLSKGEISAGSLNAGEGNEREVPDFRALLSDQLAVVQSRIDDAIRSTPAGQKWLAEDEPAYQSAKLPPTSAATIADQELAGLKAWLEQRWNATPRDTKAIQTLLKHLPGGSKLVQWTEAAPYLLTVVLITHHAFFGPVDLVVLGGYGLATWLSERISNEVTSRTRATNVRIADRFASTAHEQIERICAWLDRRAPSQVILDQLERATNDAAEAFE